jgi:hypothetical protein
MQVFYHPIIGFTILKLAVANLRKYPPSHEQLDVASILALAESCTGGLVGHRITDVPGSSAYLIGGIVGISLCKELAPVMMSILIAGRIGSAMAANKVPGVRAAACYSEALARNSREHNDANLLVLGGRLIGKGLAREILKVWLESGFQGGNHQRRLA